MNSIPKYVVSRTLEKAEWKNSTVIKGNVAEEVSRLKQQAGQDILVAGSGELVRTLMQHDLVDEYRLMVHPVVLGGGKRLFQDGTARKLLKLRMQERLLQASLCSLISQLKRGSEVRNTRTELAREEIVFLRVAHMRLHSEYRKMPTVCLSRIKLQEIGMGKLFVFNFITLNGYFEGPKKGDISWHRHGTEEMNMLHLKADVEK